VDVPVTDRLAIDGGKPVRDTFLPYGKQWLGPEEEAKVLEVLRSDWVTTGPVTREFEEAFAAFVGAKHAVACHTGTAALHLAVSALGVEPGDEVVTTPFTFAATSNAVLYRGGTPVFADVQADTKNVSPANVAKAVTKRTKAVIPVHYAGHPVDLDEVHAIAREHDLAVIEDAAHAVSAEYRGRRIGGLSDLSIFSFHPVKQMTTGEGGMVTTNDEELAAKVRAFRAHGVVTDPETRFGKGGSYFYEMKHLGHRFYMTEMQAAIGVVQLGKLAGFQRRRREIVDRYNRELAAIDGVALPVTRPYVTHAWHLYAIELTAPWLEGRRDDVFAAMRAENIGVNVHYIPVHYHPYYREKLGFRRGMFPVAERAYERILTLPLFPRMTDEDAADVVHALRKVIDAHAGVRHRAG
jgi:UDP-4-amino-4,6-dideoxy-N-acetyl-beta-L-altrosamine transaminase